ncbi:MAG TPA: ribonuclease Z [Solirubrobacteraceae bacterium]|nr:ribonuclease Z [Solirubrobacteraceae bacterium]
MDLSLFFAGTGGSVPTARRGLPAILLRRGGDRVLFDCGEGTQRQLVASAGLADVTEIFLTHFHTDHWLGLPGMLKTFDLRGRDRPLAIHGPPGLQALMALIVKMSGRVSYPLQIVELSPHEQLRRDGYRIAPVAVAHRGAAYGYVIYEDERPGVFDAEGAARLGLVPGPEFGRVQRGETIRGITPEQVLGPPRPGRKIVLSGDTSPCPALAVAAHDADLLVHEATFAAEESDRARETGHSTAGQAATVAREAGVGMLALNHVSTRYPLRVLRDEARAIFPGAVIPRDFDTIELPLAERGGPRLVRWEDRDPGVAPAGGPVAAEVPARVDAPPA